MEDKPKGDKNIELSVLKGFKLFNQNTPFVINIFAPELNEKEQKEKRINADLIFIIDISDSMGGEKINQVKKALKILVDMMSENDRIALILSESNSKVYYGLNFLSEKNKSELKILIDKIDTTIEQNRSIEIGLAQAIELLDKEKNNDKIDESRFSTVILLLDGCDSQISDFYLESNLSLSKEEKGYPFALNVFGFGNEKDSKKMEKLANLRDGSYFFVDDYSKIGQYFASIFGGCINAISKNAQLNVKLLNEKCKIMKVFGEENSYLHNLNNNNSSFFKKHMLQFIPGKEYTFVLEIFIDESKVKSGEALLDIEFIYDDIITKETIKLNNRYIYQFKDPKFEIADEEYIRSQTYDVIGQALDLKKKDINYFQKNKDKNILDDMKKWFEKYYTGSEKIFSEDIICSKQILEKEILEKNNEALIISMVSQNMSKKIGKDMKYIISIQNKLKNDYIILYNSSQRINNSKIGLNIDKKNGIKKIVLNENLPKPTKWIIEMNEPLYNLANSDNIDISREMGMLFNTGKKFKNKEEFFIIIDFNSKKEISKKEKILDKINGIKRDVDSFHSSLSKTFEELNNKYTKVISEEKEENKLNDLFDQYSNEARKILVEDIEKRNLNNTKLINSNKFKVFYSSFPEDKKMKYFNDHALLYGFYKAWVTHCPITISPNMIWQLILNVFIKYIDLNSEKLRERFVNFEGKKTLEVFQIIKDEVTFIPTKGEWESIINKITEKLGENLGENILKDFILDFSTNDDNLLFVQKVSLMSMFKKYFEYKAYLGITCGYPYINLEGTIEDWELIKKKLNEFKKFGLNDWIDKINPILNKIINTKKGEINLSFWKDIIFENYEYGGGICGGPPPSYIILTGWLSKFFPFDNKGNYLEVVKIKYENEENPLSEFSITPLIVNFPNGKELTLKILSGIIGASQDPETFCVKPELGFFILDEKWGK